MTSSPRIHRLDPLLVNKIAAGEIVERPASVVRELIDNAIDGGSTRGHADALNVSVAIESGGMELIRVSDNGDGMDPEDVRMAVEPHATSKIVTEDDLHHVVTLGFRGEALASIGAVSRLRLVSRPRDRDDGFEIRVAGRKVETGRAAGCPPGTTVEVRDLFFNVPARRKFLRAPATETGHVNEQFARAALARPTVGFRLTRNGRVAHDLPAVSDRRDRIRRFYGPELADSLLCVDRDERGTRIEAYLAPPARSRATGTWQYVFVNGRCIRDRFVQHAIREAYRGLVEHNRFPVVFLFLSVDPTSLDVNVHPTKSEVRWVQSNLIHSQVLSTLRETLQRADLTPVVRMDRAVAPVDPSEQDRVRREFVRAVRDMKPTVGAAEFAGDARPPAGWDHGPAAGDRDSGRAASPSVSPSPFDPAMRPPIDAGTVWRSLYDTPGSDRAGEAPPPSPDVRAPADALNGHEPADRVGPLRPAIQLHNMYLVVETEDGMLIIDQHALHERIMYEQLHARFAKGPLESQRLLLPESLPASPADLALIDHHKDLLDQLGIEAAPFGEGTLAVHAFPVMLQRVTVASFMRDLLDQLGGIDASRTPESVIHAVLDMMACKAAVKAGDPLTPEEIDALVAQRELVERSSNCPHGRPTTLRLTKSDLERQFKRT